MSAAVIMLGLHILNKYSCFVFVYSRHYIYSLTLRGEGGMALAFFNIIASSTKISKGVLVNTPQDLPLGSPIKHNHCSFLIVLYT